LPAIRSSVPLPVGSTHKLTIVSTIVAADYHAIATTVCAAVLVSISAAFSTAQCPAFGTANYSTFCHAHDSAIDTTFKIPNGTALSTAQWATNVESFGSTFRSAIWPSYNTAVVFSNNAA